MCEANWAAYSAPAPPPAASAVHLLPYPVAVDQAGAVTALSGHENFPDTDASVIGKKSKFLPSKLTT